MNSTTKKERADILLVERGLTASREQAKRSIMAGLVYSDSLRIEKAGEKIAVDAPLTVKGPAIKYVSRGGLKLEKALVSFPISVEGKIVLDIGASTGGFTDCALQNGAVHCYALDVGYNQLAWKIRQDERVTVMERTNFRHATVDLFTEGMPEAATIDVSFISLSLILPALKKIIVPGGPVIALVKPQFEAGKEKVGKKGIVREKTTHLEVLEKISGIAEAEGFSVKGADYSPVTGGEGNIEFLFYLVSEDQPVSQFTTEDFKQLVAQAHKDLT
ncbi:MULTISPECIES: TlyA family RNA methyltransferase [unclassified Sporosarcina]|uniref:TlyA family RNA methyltransferase n=1 Tax=unclassified Sporosarcina TaxID=2647733 RepID=UPI0020406210|nr:MULTISPECIES: TlyA family RNA methyltransferase [unclassified Sporosarcina]GKV64563.1 putative rRNA methyltransferase YqxC [Sporosarcina sp. NCCP-2331]GLB54564.1 putative rRNA methyltransferase YqxC [Sporosarcina sp. NCCP-2378]